MQVHSLEIDDFCEDTYSLIGIHTTLEDYKLAYLLNSQLKTNFQRANYSLDFGKDNEIASYSIFSYTNEKYDFEWYLISNSFTQEKSRETGVLSLSTETKNYLIPEEKRVDYFLKIIGDNNDNFVFSTINKIKSINQVVTSYSIDPNKLKSKEFLIF